MDVRSLLFVLSCVLLEVEPRRGGGSSSRGSSSARSHRSGLSSSHRLVSKSSRYTSSGIGSVKRAQMFRRALFGATAGYLTFEATHAVIRAAETPISWEGRDYYWAPILVPYKESEPQICANTIDSDDPQFGRVRFANGSRPDAIVWSCPEELECCGYECCETEGHGPMVGFLYLLLFVLMLSVFIALGFEVCRWTANCCCNKNKDDPPLYQSGVPQLLANA